MTSKIKITKGAIIYEPGSSRLNHTGDWRTERPVIDKSKCVDCGLCWEFCPEVCISPKIKIDYDYCKGCGICAQECPIKNCIIMGQEDK